MPIIHLEMPDDVKAIVLQVQAETKIKKKVYKYSQQQAIYNIIRDFNKMRNDKKPMQSS